jgi:transposase
MSKRLSMKKIKETLRLKYEMKLTNREISRSMGVSNSTVGECLKRAKAADLNFSMIDTFTEEELQQLLYSPSRNKVPVESSILDFNHIHNELKRKAVTLQLLWDEYKSQYPMGLSYSRYCGVYRDWRSTLDVCMRQTHKAGEKMFVDYAGMTVPINIDMEEIQAQIFVASLGASNYTYTEATLSQALLDWTGSHVRAFNFFGGVPEIVVPDNLKTGITKAHCYEPDLNPAYQELAEHYGVAVIPARVRAPKDKSKVEEAVQNVERQILARLRDRKFFSLYELNKSIKPLLEELNRRPFQKLPGTRLSQFEDLEKSALKPLPTTPYIFAEWKKAVAGIDYHIALVKHYYSVPYKLIKKELDVRYTQSTVEIFYKGQRIASHQRSYYQGRHTTIAEHMPKGHQEYAKWTPDRIINWAHTSGEFTGILAEKIIAGRMHPQQGYRSCLGIMRLGKRYGENRLEAACKRALHIGAYSYKSVESILKNNLDQQPLPTESKQDPISIHEYVRGKEYFQ